MSPRKIVLVTLAVAVALTVAADPAAAGRRNRALAKKAKTAPTATSQRRTVSMAGLPAHPRLLEYAELDYAAPKPFEAPSRARQRAVVVYVVEDHDLPLVSVDITVRGGDYLEPEGKQGLSDMTRQPHADRRRRLDGRRCDLRRGDRLPGGQHRRGRAA